MTHPETFNYPAFTVEAEGPSRPSEMDQRPRRRARRLPASPVARRSDSTRPTRRRSARARQPSRVRLDPWSVRWPGADRHPPPWRPHQRRERRLRRGLVPTSRPEHPTQLREGRQPLLGRFRTKFQASTARPGRRAMLSSSTTTTSRHRRSALPLHAGHDAPERVRRPRRLLPARGRVRALNPGVLPGPAPALGDSPGMRYFEIPLAIQDRSFSTDGSPSTRIAVPSSTSTVVPTSPT